MSTGNSQKIKVGILVVTGTIILVVALYFIGSRQNIFTKNIKLYAVFENVSGLQLGNNVRYSGINVGTVTKIDMKEVGKITVEMTIEQKAAAYIKKDAVASVNSDGLVGSMVVNIVPGIKPNSIAVVSEDIIQSYNSVSTDDMLKTLNKTNENAAILTADLLKVVDQILVGKGTLGTLLNDTIMSRKIIQTVAELKKTSEGTGVAMAKINQIISKVNYDKSAAAVILSDTAAANQIRKVLDNLEKSGQKVNSITSNVEEYVQEIKAGKGAVNHLTKDENFVKELDSTMIQIKEASEKLNQNMEALQHSIFFRGYFRRLEEKKNSAKQ